MSALVEIVSRGMETGLHGLQYPTETLACGHTIPRPLGLGEDAMKPAKAKRRRCWKCAA